MQDFRQRTYAFYEARQPLVSIKERSEGYIDHWEGDKLRKQAEAALPALIQARDNVAQYMADATTIADGYHLPTAIQIMPPPLLGGYSHTLNLFQAATEHELPYDFDVQPTKVIDLINQTIWAIERDIRAEQEHKPTLSVAKKAGSGIAAGLRAIFKTETDRHSEMDCLCGSGRIHPSICIRNQIRSHRQTTN